jgi:hypothetical protein
VWADDQRHPERRHIQHTHGRLLRKEEFFKSTLVKPQQWTVIFQPNTNNFRFGRCHCNRPKVLLQSFYTELTTTVPTCIRQYCLVRGLTACKQYRDSKQRERSSYPGQHCYLLRTSIASHLTGADVGYPPGWRSYPSELVDGLSCAVMDN